MNQFGEENDEDIYQVEEGQGPDDVEEEEVVDDSDTSGSEDAESDDESDEGSGDLERLREEDQRLRQVLADKEEELRLSSAAKSQKLLTLWNQIQPAPVAAGGGGVGLVGLGGGAAEVPGHQDAQQGRLQRAFTWARNRPEWEATLQQLRERYASLSSVSDLEIQVFCFIRVMEANGLAPAGLPRRT